ncbi:MAG: DUF2442 domain-containing protein [Rhodocyclaceae bacterium]|nr:DUF2442 domain-containing protein [Rhodocyclaceae bacterium]
MNEYHRVENAKVDDSGCLSMTIDGQASTVQLRQLTQCLCKATYEQIAKFEISPSGYGIHWPLIDEDISIDGLLGIVHQPAMNRMAA